MYRVCGAGVLEGVPCLLSVRLLGDAPILRLSSDGMAVITNYMYLDLPKCPALTTAEGPNPGETLKWYFE
jgi:hypothetical protein